MVSWNRVDSVIILNWVPKGRVTKIGDNYTNLATSHGCRQLSFKWYMNMSLRFCDIEVAAAVVRSGWFHLGRWSFQMLRVYWRRKRSPYFCDIPALKIGRYFTGIAAETAAAIFPVKRRYFSGSTPLTPLFFRLNAVNAFIPTKNAVNVAIFPVKRR